MANAFSKYQDAHTTHKIEALDGAEVVLRELTLKEGKEIAAEIIKGFNDKGDPEIDFEKANASKIKKISLALIEPAMTVEELEALGQSASEALDEIFAIVDPKTVEAIRKAKEKEAGNDTKTSTTSPSD